MPLVTALEPGPGGVLSEENKGIISANFSAISTALGSVTGTPTGTGSVALSTNPTITTPAVTGGTFATPAVTGMTQDVGNALSGAGTTRADATALTKTVNNVTTAASGTGVVLPTLTIGTIVYIFNAGASALQVYGAGSATIDGVAAATGVPLTNAKRAIFIAVAANTWISAQLGVVSA